MSYTFISIILCSICILQIASSISMHRDNSHLEMHVSYIGGHGEKIDEPEKKHTIAVKTYPLETPPPVTTPAPTPSPTQQQPVNNDYNHEHFNISTRNGIETYVSESDEYYGDVVHVVYGANVQLPTVPPKVLPQIPNSNNNTWYIALPVYNMTNQTILNQTNVTAAEPIVHSSLEGDDVEMNTGMTRGHQNGGYWYGSETGVKQVYHLLQ